jgi:hypothetical protein
VKGTFGTVNNVLDETGSTVRETVGGALGLVRDAGSGIVNLGKGSTQLNGAGGQTPQNQRNTVYGTNAVYQQGSYQPALGPTTPTGWQNPYGMKPPPQTQGNDHFSYFGKLGTRWGDKDPIPLTASFAEFRK